MQNVTIDDRDEITLAELVELLDERLAAFIEHAAAAVTAFSAGIPE